MEYTYRYYKETQFLIIQYKDEFNLQDYLQSLDEIQNHCNWLECRKILIDTRKLSHAKGTKLVEDLLNARKKEKLHDYRLAYLVDHPNTTVVVHLYIDGLNNPNYKYCSTLEAIISHLNLNLSSNKLENMLQEINQKE